MIRRSLLTLLLCLIAALSLPGLASAEGEPNPELIEMIGKGDLATLLETLDARHNPFKDQEVTIKMKTFGDNGGNEIEIVVMTQGEGKNRAIKFNKPASTKGMGLVIRGADEIYVKLPGAPKVRRVGTHSRKQSFQGTDWSFDDMALIRYTPYYTVTKQEEVEGHYTLHLKLKEGADISYSELILHVDKHYFMIDKIQYFEKGEEVKVQERSAPKMLSNYFVFSKQIMRDLKKDTWTESELLEEKIDQGLPDSNFSRRWLIRGL